MPVGLIGLEVPGARFACYVHVGSFTVGPNVDDDSFHAVLHEHLATTRHPRLLAWIDRVDQLPRRPA